MKNLIEGDKVKILQDHFGYKKGDIGTIVRPECSGYDIFVPNRISTSGKKPNVFFTYNQIELLSEEINNNYSIY